MLYGEYGGLDSPVTGIEGKEGTSPGDLAASGEDMETMTTEQMY